MHRKVVIAILIISLIAALAACSQHVQNNPKKNLEYQEKNSSQFSSPTQIIDINEARNASIFGIHLDDSKDKVAEILGIEYKQTLHDEAGHFPEAFYNWEYDKGFTISIGKNSNKVLQIITTSAGVKTNLEIQVGDNADEALQTYRAKYIEPESIHGGKLLGVFKVENGQALIFDFNIEDGLVNPLEEIESDAKIERIILTYPEYLDDSF